MPRQLQDEKYRAQALIGLADKLPSVLPEALSSARQLQDEKYQGSILDVLDKLPPGWLPEALSIATQIPSARQIQGVIERKRANIERAVRANPGHAGG